MGALPQGGAPITGPVTKRSAEAQVKDRSGALYFLAGSLKGYTCECGLRIRKQGCMLCTSLKPLPAFQTSLLTAIVQSRPLRKWAAWRSLGGTSEGHSSGCIDYSALSPPWLTHKNKGIRSWL